MFIYHNLELIINNICGPTGVEAKLGDGDWRSLVREHINSCVSGELATPIIVEQILGVNPKQTG